MSALKTRLGSVYWCEKYSGTKSRMFLAHWWGRSSFNAASSFEGRGTRTVALDTSCSAARWVLGLGQTMLASSAAFQTGRSADESPRY